ncbi:MAG TPA: hypothetical protein VHV30_01120 [Polyangiaceae bacterium]|nr:hypothetical protein [Polyangiaceae bacterium]
MDVAEPPRIVVESRVSCTDSAKAGALLREAIGGARAPRSSWVVRMRVEASSSAERGLQASGEIDDEHGLPVANRVLTAPSNDCNGLTRAVGVWASLVLEQEAKRDRTPIQLTAATDAQSTDSLWPAPQPQEPPPAEHDWYLHHDNNTRDVELGAAGFLMTGAGAGAMAGVSPYLTLETGHGLFLRPSLAVGEAVSALNTPPVVHALWWDARFDACLRLPGLYSTNQGIQLDLCGGTDLGALRDSTDSRTVPYISLGPSLDLRGELGSLLSATLRGIAGVNVRTDAAWVSYQPLWSGRVELALSWKVK